MVVATWIIASAIRALRWRWIFLVGEQPTLWVSFKAMALGNLLNLVLPARSGDIARCVLSRRGRTISGTAAAIVVLGMEKVLDGMAALSVLVLAAGFQTLPTWFFRLSLTAGLVFVGAAFVLALLHWHAARIGRAIRAVGVTSARGRWGEGLAAAVEQFASGLGAVASPWQMGALVLLTAGIWLVEAAFVMGLARSLGLPLDLPESLVSSSVIVLGMMVPAAPVNIGSYELFAVSRLEMFGIASEAALALPLVMHACACLSVTLLGALAWAAEGVGWARLRDLARRSSSPDPAY